MFLESNCIQRTLNVVDYKTSRFSAKISSFTPKLNNGKYNVNHVNTYKTILVVFTTHIRLKNTFDAQLCLALVWHMFLKIHPSANFWYPASSELDKRAISNRMKSLNNDVYDYYTILLERDCIIFRQKTFKGEFLKNTIFFLKTMIFQKN